MDEFIQAELQLLNFERSLTYALRKQGKINEDVLHKIEKEIDFEEAKIRLELYEE